jgi:hypothetical protein
MVKQEIAVTKSTGFRANELTVIKGGRKTVVKLYYDMDGYLSKVEASGAKLDLATLAGVLNQSYLNMANIQTAEADNIVIDKLTQGAYTERHSTLENPALTTPPLFFADAFYRSKFFPRGCRGWIEQVKIRARNLTGGDLTMDFGIAPYVGCGEVIAFTATIPAGANGTVDIDNNIRRFWNYDSMWIFSRTVANANLGLGYDIGVAPDGCYSADLAGWIDDASRIYVSAVMKKETAGDLPVSGTVNNIEIPNIATVRQQQSLNVPISSELLDTIQYGSGKTLWVMFWTNTVGGLTSLVPRIYADGILVLPVNVIMSLWYLQYVGLSKEGIFFGQYDAATPFYCMVVTLRIPFRRSLQVGFYNASGANPYTGEVSYCFEKIS